MASSTAPDLRSVQTDSQRDSLQSATPPWKPVVMQAKVRTPCSQCHLSISPGNAIYPWVRPVLFHECKPSTRKAPQLLSLLQRNYTGYMHLSCALKEAQDAGIELQPPVRAAD